MRHISVNSVEKIYKGRKLDEEYIRSLTHAHAEFPMPHVLFDSLAKTVSDYIYYVDFCGSVWRKTKYKDEFYYYSEDYQDWVFDDDMDASTMQWTSENECIYRLVK